MTTKNLTKTGKKISVLTLAFLASGLIFALTNREIDIRNKDVAFCIIFAEVFSGDHIDVYLNNKEVARNVCLVSSPSAGVASFNINILNRNGTYHAQVLLGNEEDDNEAKLIKLPISNDKGFSVHISYKGMLVEFKLDKEKGKYIQIRSDRNHLRLIQSHKMFMFD